LSDIAQKGRINLSSALNPFGQGAISQFTNDDGNNNRDRKERRRDRRRDKKERRRDRRRDRNN
jgi:hypothetical protein